VNRSLSILLVTIVVVVAAYYGFSRFASTSAPPGNQAQAPLAATQNATGKAAAATEGMGQVVESTSASTVEPPSARTAVAQAPGAFSIVIDRAHPPAPTDVIRVSKDDPVTLSVTTDRPGNLEVHGYRKEVKVQPGTTGTLSFVANMTGRFPIDLHASDGEHIEVTALEVMPR
jgi:hypothetical protein